MDCGHGWRNDNDCDICRPPAIVVAGLRGRISDLEEQVKAWEKWFDDLQADFGGVTDDALNPSRVHDWNWIANYRPSPSDAGRRCEP